MVTRIQDGRHGQYLDILLKKLQNINLYAKTTK